MMFVMVEFVPTQEFPGRMRWQMTKLVHGNWRRAIFPRIIGTELASFESEFDENLSKDLLS